MHRPNSVPIIVGGCHRSGTSLLRRILDAHSRIYCGPEVKFFRDFYQDYFYDPLQHDRFMPTARTILPTPELFELLGHDFVRMHELAAAHAGKVRWADKNPENIIYLADWQRLLGDDWVLVHIVRNPLDTLASLKQVGFDGTIPPHWEARIAFYKRYIEAGLEFEARCPGRYRRVIYEELVTQPTEVLPALMAWLGETFEPIQLHFNQVAHQAGLEDPKIAQTTGIHGDSVARWRSTLTPSEAAQIAEACRPLWRELDPEEKWMPSAAQIADAVRDAPPVEVAERAQPSTAGLGQISPELAQRQFELEQQAIASDRWNKELLEQIALRDRELARLKNFWPIRLARTVKGALTPRR